eukprot:NODE_7596_length_1565_cov_2.760779.p1 GENE.NODE_7596_length_1565_cov_2.760779~~NODE_7596_length_1565_cov_2.760779.p1  ORF type:complete len:418 (+),score=121.54 NODE_7596_length_1565_cov_2.760779:68-1321(+)
MPAASRTQLGSTAVRYFRDAAGSEEWCREFVLRRGAQAVGLDAEWCVTFKQGAPQRPIAVLQMAAWASEPSRALSLRELLARPVDVGVFHVHRWPVRELPSALHKVLLARSVQKVGVRTLNDVKKLARDGLLDAATCERVEPSVVNLEGVLRVHDIRAGRPPDGSYSLDAMTQRFWPKRPVFNRPRLSNWEIPHLSEAQLAYCAEDAAMSLRVHAAVASLPEVPVPPVNARGKHAKVKLKPRKDTATSPRGSPPGTASELWTEGVELKLRKDDELYVPPRRYLKPLGPTEEALWHAVFGEGGSLKSAAVARKLKHTTAEKYLLNSISNGWPYLLGPRVALSWEAVRRVHYAVRRLRRGSARSLAMSARVDLWSARAAVAHLRALHSLRLRRRRELALLECIVGSTTIDGAVWKFTLY